MVEAFATLGAPVWFFNRQAALFREGIVRESLPCGHGAVVLRWWLRGLWLWLLLLLLLFILQMDPLMPGEGRGVIESFATVSAGVTLPL